MDLKTKTLFWCLLAFVEILNFVSSAGMNFIKYDYDFDLAGNRCSPNETVFDVDKVFDPVQCAKLCYNKETCKGFFYQPDSYRCIGCRFNLDIMISTYETYPGSLYFHTKSTYGLVDCKDVLKKNPTAPSGLYEIYLQRSNKVLTVFCDMDTGGGGWTVIQNRFDGSTSFNRNFFDYENGFGELTAEFWLGLKHIQELANQGETEIRLEMLRNNSEEGFETYKDFKLLDDTDYKLSINTESTERSANVAYSSFGTNKGSAFTTSDKDMDIYTGNCAESAGSGWWHKQCTDVNLNGIYCRPGRECDYELDGYDRWMTFYHDGFAGFESLKGSRMLIRRK